VVGWFSEENSADLEGLELLVEAGDGGGEAVLADVPDVPRPRRRRLLLLLRAGGRPRGPLRLELPLRRRRPLAPLPLLLVLVLRVLTPRPAGLPAVGLPPHPGGQACRHSSLAAAAAVPRRFRRRRGSPRLPRASEAGGSEGRVERDLPARGGHRTGRNMRGRARWEWVGAASYSTKQPGEGKGGGARALAMAAAGGSMAYAAAAAAGAAKRRDW